jgi:hypothetical protein
MIVTELQEVADSVVRRAHRQGFVVPRDVREELAGAGVSRRLWKDVLARARSSLRFRQGRYYYVPALSPRVRQEQRQQRALHRAVRQVIRQYRASAAQVDRRRQNRVDFIQPVQVQTDDGRLFTLLSRDLSLTGIRLIGTRSLLGQKVRVTIPREGEAEPWCFLVRILWTCGVADGLFENGGSFLEMLDSPTGEDDTVTR